MADSLSATLPALTRFTKGQVPTSDFLNGLEIQIEEAFRGIGDAIGDYNGSGEGPKTYLTSLVRAMGQVGLLSRGLPADMYMAAGVPRIREELSTFSGTREAELSFRTSTTNPGADANWASFGIGSPTGAITSTDELTKDLTAADLFNVRGRRLLTSSTIDPAANIIYPVDTTAEESVPVAMIPNPLEVAAALEAGALNLATLCTASAVAGNVYDIAFPDVRRVLNPLIPFPTQQSDVLRLDDVAGAVRWNGTAPKYAIPSSLISIANMNGGIIPENMCTLWVQNGATISKVYDPSAAIQWSLVPGSVDRVRITVPPNLAAGGALELPHLGDPTLTSRYFIAVGGWSVSEGAALNQARMKTHRHDGKDETSGVDAGGLTNRLPIGVNHSVMKGNFAPQYLLRSGYDALGTDPGGQNGQMVGNILMAGGSVTTASFDAGDNLTEDSRAIYFGSIAGPSIFWRNADDSMSLDPAGKLEIGNGRSIRSTGEFALGAVGGPEFNMRVRTEAVGSSLSIFGPGSDPAAGTWDGTQHLKVPRIDVGAGFIGFSDVAHADGLHGTLTGSDAAPGVVGSRFVAEISRGGAGGGNSNEATLRVGRHLTNSIQGGVGASMTHFIPAHDFRSMPVTDADSGGGVNLALYTMDNVNPLLTRDNELSAPLGVDQYVNAPPAGVPIMKGHLNGGQVAHGHQRADRVEYRMFDAGRTIYASAPIRLPYIPDPDATGSSSSGMRLRKVDMIFEFHTSGGAALPADLSSGGVTLSVGSSQLWSGADLELLDVDGAGGWNNNGSQVAEFTQLFGISTPIANRPFVVSLDLLAHEMVRTDNYFLDFRVIKGVSPIESLSCYGARLTYSRDRIL